MGVRSNLRNDIGTPVSPSLLYPVTALAIIEPIAGASLNPLPLKPLATQNPSTGVGPTSKCTSWRFIV